MASMLKQMRSELRAYESVDTFIAFRSADLRKARDERHYLAVSLSDKTGQINGYIWDNPKEIADRLKGKTYVYVQGLVKMHNGALILSIEYIRPAQDEEIEIDDFLDVVPGEIKDYGHRFPGEYIQIDRFIFKVAICAFENRKDAPGALQICLFPTDNLHD